MQDASEAASDVSRPTDASTERRVAWAVVALAMYLSGWFVHAFHGTFALDVDPMNFVYAMRRFSVAESSPHAPGYLLYVGLLRGLHSVVAADASLLDRFRTTQLLALVFHVATVPMVFAIVRRIRPDAPQLAALSALLTAFHPFLLFHSIDAQMHGAEAFAAAALLLAVVRYFERPTLAAALALGVCLALGSALRPSFVVGGVGPILYVCRKRPTHVVAAGLSSILGALLWVLPTFAASGGYEVWKAANDALVGGIFVRNSSLLSTEGIPEFQLHQLFMTSIWIALLLAPVALAAVCTSLQRRSLGPDDELANGRTEPPLGAWTLAATVPTLLFYLLLFCSEPGYFSGLVPFYSAWIATRPPAAWPARARRLAPLAAAGIHMIVLLLPPASTSMQVKLPSLPELVERDLMSQAWIDAFDRVTRPGRVLVVGDFPDVTLSRQIAMQRPGVHYLGFYSDAVPAFRETTGSLLTEDRWMPIPGPIHLVPASPKIIEVDESYDWIVVDLLASPVLRAEIERASACGTSIRGSEDFSILPAACLRDQVLALDGQGIRFRSREGGASDDG